MRKRVWKRWLALLLCVAVLCLALTELWLMPLLETVGIYRSQLLYDSTISGLLTGILEEYELTTEDLLTIRTNEIGEVTSLTADTVALHRIQAQLNDRLMAELRQAEGITFSVPWGSLFGGVWLTDRGPEIPLRLTAETMATIGLKDEFTAVGINQTCYTLWATVDQDVLLIYAGHHRMLTLHSEAMLVQTVLMGEVPTTYVDGWNT